MRYPYRSSHPNQVVPNKFYAFKGPSVFGDELDLEISVLVPVWGLFLGRVSSHIRPQVVPNKFYAFKGPRDRRGLSNTGHYALLPGD